jgi:hypothetical protein
LFLKHNESTEEEWKKVAKDNPTALLAAKALKPYAVLPKKGKGKGSLGKYQVGDGSDSEDGEAGDAAVGDISMIGRGANGNDDDDDDNIPLYSTASAATANSKMSRRERKRINRKKQTKNKSGAAVVPVTTEVEGKSPLSFTSHFFM